MARPAEQKGPQASTVSACSARDCMYNEDGDCHAGSIRVEMREGGPVCATYNPEPKARP
jgi:hypothetical protein